MFNFNDFKFLNIESVNYNEFKFFYLNTFCFFIFAKEFDKCVGDYEKDTSYFLHLFNSRTGELIGFAIPFELCNENHYKDLQISLYNKCLYILSYKSYFDSNDKFVMYIGKEAFKGLDWY